MLSQSVCLMPAGGSQHKITEEDVIVVNKLQAETGSKILLNKVHSTALPLKILVVLIGKQ